MGLLWLSSPMPAVILTKDAERFMLQALPGLGGSHSCAALLGPSGGRWVSPAWPRQLWNGMGVGWAAPRPRKPRTCPDSQACNIQGLPKLFLLVLQVSPQVPLSPGSPLDSQAACGPNPTSQTFRVGPHSPHFVTPHPAVCQVLALWSLSTVSS